MKNLLASNVARLGTLTGVLAVGAAVFGFLGEFAPALGLTALAVLLTAVTGVASHRGMVKIARWQRDAARRDHLATKEAIAKATARLQAKDSGGRGGSGRRAATTGNNLGRGGLYWGVGPKFEYAQRIASARSNYETYALRSKSTGIRDAFARAATGMQFDVADVLNIVRAMHAGRFPSGRQTVAAWDSTLLLTLARIMANQRSSESDVEDARLIFRTVWDVVGRKALGKTDVYTYSEILAVSGEHDEARRVFQQTGAAGRDPMQARLIELNSLAAQDLSNSEIAGQWISSLNRLYAAEGLSEVAWKEETPGTPLDALTTSHAARAIEGPLVTVLIPTHNGADYLDTTLRCLHEQTWKNLEIIVIDDASSPDQVSAVERICERYAEVKLLLQDTNQGAYIARNTGLAVARGEFITVHDDDDWSHPQKIQVQAEHLQRNRKAAANMTRHARASEGLVLTRINNNPAFSQPNFSSLMFRRTVVDKVGPWDVVNRGADSEFRDRLVLDQGEPIEVLLDAPLSFTRTHSTSLTAGEMGRGYVDPARLLYLAAYQAAHREAHQSGCDMRELDFARPLNLLPGNRGKHLGAFDVVFVTDFRFPGGTMSLTMNEIEAAADAGLRVGVVQLESPLNKPIDPVSSRLLEQACRDNVSLLSLKDRLKASVVVVRHPSVLQYSEGLTSGFEAERVIVIVNNPPVLTGGTGIGYDLPTIAANAERLFHVRASIVAESGVTKELAQRMFPSHLVEEETWPGFIDVDRFAFEDRAARPGDVPVLGRHSRDHALKWPDSEEAVRQLYAGDADLRCKVLGGVSSLPSSVAAVLREKSEVIEFGEMSPEDFLKRVDFWAYFHSARLTESFGMATAEALASGAVVFLPRYMESTFGDGAVYVEPHEVRARALELWADPDAYLEQSRRARAVARAKFSREAFLERIGKLLGTTVERPETDAEGC